MRSKARIKAARLIITDSFKNCLMRFPRFAPNVFLIPISGARKIPWAVVRLIKFIQASNKINNEINENIRIFETEPFLSLPSTAGSLTNFVQTLSIS